MSRSALPWLLLGALALANLTTFSLRGRGAEEARTLVGLYERAADSIAVQRDSLARANAIRAQEYSADSIRWEAQRAELQQIQVRAQQAAARARLRADSIASEMATQLDSAGLSMLQAHLAEDDSIDALTDRALKAKDEQIATITADRDDLARQLLGVRTELAAATQEARQWKGAYEAEHALRLAIEEESRPSLLERAADVGEKLLAAKELFDQVVPS